MDAIRAALLSPRGQDNRIVLPTLLRLQGVAAGRACDAGDGRVARPRWQSRNHARLLGLTVVLVSQSLG